MQPHLEQLIKDLVSYLLDFNILVQSDTPEKKLFGLAVLAINYHQLIRLLTPTQSIFFWLDRLSPLIDLPTNLNCTKSENNSDNCNMGKEGNKVSWTKEMAPANPNRTKSKSYNDICSKNYYNINNGVGVQQLLLDDTKSSINNYNIDKVGDEVTWTEEMPPTNPIAPRQKVKMTIATANATVIE